MTAIQRECNWFQGLEGDIDTSHFSFLHAGSMDVTSQQPGTFSYYMLADRAPRYSVVRGWVPMDDTHTMFYMAGPKFLRRGFVKHPQVDTTITGPLV